MEEMSFHYPVRKTTEASGVEEFEDFSISEKDKKVLRELAKKKAEIARMDIQQEKVSMWKRLNSLEEVRPLIWINEIPWHEMDAGGELELQTRDEFCRIQEGRLRRTI